MFSVPGKRKKKCHRTRPFSLPVSPGFCTTSLLCSIWHKTSIKRKLILFPPWRKLMIYFSLSEVAEVWKQRLVHIGTVAQNSFCRTELWSLPQTLVTFWSSNSDRRITFAWFNTSFREIKENKRCNLPLIPVNFPYVVASTASGRHLGQDRSGQ